MKIRSADTIAAIATPIGEGAISVIRVSGPDCFGIVDNVFRGSTSLVDAGGYTVHYGRIVDAKGNLIDLVLATVFRDPHSYTGENSVEISSHGGLMVTRLVLESILRAGARQADPGEFTKRAFLNGKLDLSQAEAVADLIAARSNKAHMISVGQLAGRLSKDLRPLKNDLVEACSLLELELDFAEEEIPLISRDRVSSLIQRVDARVTTLVQSYETGRVYRDGALVVLVGRPNVGKSSLFNRLLLEERAIVSARPGTTRDFIEEPVVIDNMLFRIIDTAGIRETDDFVEGAGVRKTNDLVKKSDIVLEVVDSTMEKEPEYLSGTGGNSYKVVLVRNKVDLMRRSGRSGAPKNARPSVFVSALTGEGIDELKKAIVLSMVGNTSVSAEETIPVTSRRQLGALLKCKESLVKAQESIHFGATNEFISLDLRQAIGALSEILGEITNEDILNSVFGNFCIGK